MKRIVERRSKLPEHEASVYRGARNRRGMKKSTVECKRAGRRLLERGKLPASFEGLGHHRDRCGLERGSRR